MSVKRKSRRTNGTGGVDFYAPLTRRELKNVIDIIDHAIEGDKLVDKAVEALRKFNLNIREG